MTRSTYSIPAAPTCNVRGCSREASFDGESRSYFGTCDECGLVGFEHCIARECLVGGHTWLQSDRRRLADGSYVFTCPSCGFVGDRLAWAARTGRIAGEVDRENKVLPWLVGTRREVQEKALRDAFTPRTRRQWGEPSWGSIEYARAYLAATA